MIKKNILFYIPSLSQDLGGVRQYACSLLKLFPDLANTYKFFIYHDNKDPNIINVLKENPQFKLIKPGQFKLSKLSNLISLFKYFSLKVLSIMKNNPTDYVRESDLDFVVDKFSIDIIHCPYQFLPVFPNSRKKKIKLIVTMHDVQELHFPEFFSAESRAFRAVSYMNYINRADSVVVSYDHVKGDIKNFFNKNDESIFVILLKMSNLWFKKYDHLKFKRIEIVDKYLFYPANFWKHKNHHRLVEAIKYLKVNNNLHINLILTGDFNTTEGPILNKLIEEFDLMCQIKILGIVSEEELFHLYKNSIGVVIPTLYEAGSFPLMESILMEIPVICSNVTSLPETIGNEMFIFDPYSIEDISKKIELLWNSKEFRNQSIENSKIQQIRLINTNAVSILHSIYKMN